MIFFIVNTIKIINKKEISKEKNTQSFFKKSLNFLIFLLPFYILSFYFIPRFHEWNGTYLELYQYHNFPCENKTFITKEKMALLTHHDGMLPKSAYYITHNSLRKYKKDLERDYYNKISIIPIGTRFKIIGYYLPIALRLSHTHYYLIESLDNNKTKAWIDYMNFDIEKCYPEEIYYKGSHFFPKKGTYGEEKINLKKMDILP